jgi:nitrate reductase NapE component
VSIIVIQVVSRTPPPLPRVKGTTQKEHMLLHLFVCLCVFVCVCVCVCGCVWLCGVRRRRSGIEAQGHRGTGAQRHRGTGAQGHRGIWLLPAHDGDKG